MPTTCPPGKILNPKTGRCVLLKHAAKYAIKADENQVDKDAKKPIECPPGKILNPKTGRCVLIKHAAKYGVNGVNIDKNTKKDTKKPIECPPGKILNPKTGKCIMKKNANKYGIPVSPPAESHKKSQKISPKVLPKVSPKKSNINKFLDPFLKYFTKVPIDKKLLETAKGLQKELQKARNRLQIVEGEFKLQQFRVSRRIYGDLLNELDKYVSIAIKNLKGNKIKKEADILFELRMTGITSDWEKVFNIIKSYIPDDQKISFASFTEIFKEKTTKINLKLKSIALTYKNAVDEYNKLYKQFQDIQKKLPKLEPIPINAFSAVSSAPGPSINKYLVVGHGYEVPVAFEHRKIVPMNQTLVVFPSSGLSNYSDKSCKFTEFFHNPNNSKILSDPVKYKDKIENALKYPIRVYKPGDLMPNLKTTLFLQFVNPTEISLVKSGVFKAGVMAKIDSKIMKPSPIFTHFQRGCYDYSGSIESPEHYTETVHKELYKDNVYKYVNDYLSFKMMRYRKFALSDIMKNVGNGVYYFVGCRDTVEIVPDNIIAMSNAQQNKK